MHLILTCSVMLTRLSAWCFHQRIKERLSLSAFPSFMLNGVALQYVSEFKYLGRNRRIDSNDNDNADDEDVHLLFTRAIIDLTCVLYPSKLYFVSVSLYLFLPRDARSASFPAYSWVLAKRLLSVSVCLSLALR